MPKEPKRKNRRNPLRVLRELLSEHGKDRPITQEDFSKLIATPANTIRAIEAGQRKLSSTIISQIAPATGALWNYPNRRWVELDDKTPFTFQSFVNFRKQVVGRPVDQAQQVNLLRNKFWQLFRFVDDARWWELRLRAGRFIEDSWFEFEIEKSPKHRAWIAKDWSRVG